jgi:chemotaxis protein histidine kinase CheA
VHVIRNAVDHGIEAPSTREEAGKGGPKLELKAFQNDRELHLAIIDDGKGVDWEEIRARARGKGLPAETKNDLIAALFAGGLSTRDQVTDTSGRGVGMSALQAAVATLDGVIDVVSTPGAGTRIELRFARHPIATSLAS